jgi:hypothetical protein
MTQAHDAGKQPQIIDLGSISKKNLKRLRRGEGSAMDEVRLQSGKTSGAADPPVIVLYRKKWSRGSGGRSPRKLGLPFPFPFC